MDAFIINKLTGSQLISSVKAHELGIVNLSLEYDIEIIDLVNKFISSKLNMKLDTIFINVENFAEIT